MEVKVTKVTQVGDELLIEGTIDTIVDEEIVGREPVTEEVPILDADGKPRMNGRKKVMQTVFKLDEHGEIVMTDGELVTTLRPLKAVGWLSAMEQHYDPKHYFAEGATVQDKDDDGKVTQVRDVSGHLKPDAKPRAMTKKERLDYCKRLLVEQNVQTDAQSQPASHEAVELDIKG